MYAKELQRIKFKLETYAKEGKQVFATSSFQSHSIPLLHIISRIAPNTPIYYLNTGYLFPETLSFKEELITLLGLEIIGVKPGTPKSQQKDEKDQMLFTSDPDYCCYLNKIQPMEPILAEKDIWINGIRADQSDARKQRQEEETAAFGCTRYHPMLNWTSKMVYAYIKEFNLPPHPLEVNGYLSIGCEPCTRKFTNPDSREGRWFGLNKTECGLHTELVK